MTADTPLARAIRDCAEELKTWNAANFTPALAEFIAAALEGAASRVSELEEAAATGDR